MCVAVASSMFCVLLHKRTQPLYSGYVRCRFFDTLTYGECMYKSNCHMFLNANAISVYFHGKNKSFWKIIYNFESRNDLS